MSIVTSDFYPAITAIRREINMLSGVAMSECEVPTYDREKVYKLGKAIDVLVEASREYSLHELVSIQLSDRTPYQQAALEDIREAAQKKCRKCPECNCCLGSSCVC